MKTNWPLEKQNTFREWHEARMAELNYPPALVQELTKAREQWLSTAIEGESK